MIELKGEVVMCPPDGSKVDYSLNYEKLVREIVDTDSNGKKTVTEFYRCRHCGNVWEHEVYKEF